MYRLKNLHHYIIYTGMPQHILFETLYVIMLSYQPTYFTAGKSTWASKLVYLTTSTQDHRPNYNGRRCPLGRSFATGSGWHQIHRTWPILTYWGRDKIAVSLQRTFSNGFSKMKMHEFYWGLFLRVKLNDIPVLVQSMAWRRQSDKPLSEPMMVR